ncbi:MAG: hypothetical protein OXE94_01065 [Aestuariivita sp.]|nr:hypothetical protein [Aestuariivita sp.]MCY4203535.1 hypothetical protein [Aestuariivita sp.]
MDQRTRIGWGEQWLRVKRLYRQHPIGNDKQPLRLARAPEAGVIDKGRGTLQSFGDSRVFPRCEGGMKSLAAAEAGGLESVRMSTANTRATAPSASVDGGEKRKIGGNVRVDLSTLIIGIGLRQ